MKWEDFIETTSEARMPGQEETDIECPKCGRKIYFDATIILTTYPAKYSYWCVCGWTGTSPVRWARKG